MSWRRNLIVLSAVQILAMAGMSMVMPFLAFYIETLGIHNEAEQRFWSGLILGVSLFFAAVMGPVWGTVGDRWGRKPMIVRAILGTGLAILAMGFVGNVYQLLVLRVIQGALGGFVSASITLVAVLTPRERGGMAVGVIMGSVFAGNAVGPLLGGALAQAFGYKAVFIITGSMLMLAAAVVWGFVREEKMNHLPGTEPRLLHTLGEFFRSRHLLGISGALLAVQTSVAMAAPILALFIKQDLKVEVNLDIKTGLVYAVTNVITALSAPLWGHFADQRGHRQVLLWCILGTTLLLPVQALAPTVLFLVLTRVLLGVFTGGIVPTSRALISQSVPAHRLGGLYGCANAAVLLGNALGPILGGAFASGYGNKPTFVLSGVCLLLAFALTYRLIPVRTRDEQPEPEPAE